MNRNVNERRRRSKNELVIRSRKRKFALRTKTITPYHRGDMMNALGHGYAMHDKHIYQPAQDARKTIFSYPPCIGHHGLFAVITMVPNACN